MIRLLDLVDKSNLSLRRLIKKVLITLYFKNLNQSWGFKFPFSQYIRIYLNNGITVKRTMKLIEKQLDDMAGQTSYVPCLEG